MPGPRCTARSTPSWHACRRGADRAGRRRAAGAKEYAITPDGAGELRDWLRDTEPSRGTRSDPLLRVFLLWLLEPAEAEAHLRREAEYLRGLLAELEEVAAGPREDTRIELSYGLALDWGLRETRARLAWAEAAIATVASPEWRDAA